MRLFSTFALGLIVGAAAIGALSPAALAGPNASPEDAEVYIIAPQDGATVKSPFKVQFGLKGMGVAPAGTAKEHTGHHHLLIDVAPPAGEDLEMPLPADEQHLHFGGGQTEVMLDLEPGTHTLQLVLGDENHVPHNPPVMSDIITITVE